MKFMLRSLPLFLSELAGSTLLDFLTDVKRYNQTELPITDGMGSILSHPNLNAAKTKQR